MTSRSTYPKCDVAFVGSLPPPLGGVSVYIQRKMEALRREGKKVEAVDLAVRKESAFTRFRRILAAFRGTRADLYEINTQKFRYILLTLLTAKLRGGQVQLTIHNPDRFWERSTLHRAAFPFLLASVDLVVANGQHIIDAIGQSGYHIRAYRVEPTFYPPPLEQKDLILDSYPPEFREFVRRHQPIIVGGAFRIVFEQEVDLYGLDMMVELLLRLKSRYADAGLIIFIAEANNEEYLRTLQRHAGEGGAVDSLLLVTGQKQLWPAMSFAQVFVRPTLHDGYGVSIAEALYVGTPAVASAVCDRPNGTVLFKARDMDDFLGKVVTVLATSSEKSA